MWSIFLCVCWLLVYALRGIVYSSPLPVFVIRLVFVVSCSSLYFLDINTLSGVWLATILSHSIGCLCTLLIVSLDAGHAPWQPSSSTCKPHHLFALVEVTLAVGGPSLDIVMVPGGSFFLFQVAPSFFWVMPLACWRSQARDWTQGTAVPTLDP